MWDLPGPGLEPVSPALTGGFLTTAPPGKSCASFLRRLNSRSSWPPRAQEIHWQWAGWLLNKTKCAQTQVFKDSYLLTGLFSGEAILATLISKPQHFSGLPQ